jgi:phage portal protein BeeE
VTNDIRVSEWDGTPWAGQATVIEPMAALATRPARKAVTGPGVLAYNNDVPLRGLFDTPQRRAAAALRAYKVGWFYKAESKISDDVSTLKVQVAHEDDEGDNEATVVEPDLFTPWERLDPLGQFLRLMERPNPKMTGRTLRKKTMIRLDMAGWAHWYLEGAAMGLPTAIYGVSPARMWPSYDNRGILIGWVMDRDKPGGGVPFDADEILTFSYANGDDGETDGTGIFDAISAELPLGELMARHTSDLLTTGGRLAGMLSPKNGSLDEDEFADAQRAWRNVASDPNAARRLLLFPEPMEYQAGASTPAEIGIPALADLNRDNILTAFPISPYQLGVPIPGGLNSAETRREDRFDYWQGTIHPRVELIEETIQIGLLSRYEAILGTTYDFDIIEPNLDTSSSIIEKVAALKALIEEGFDDKAAVEAVGLDHIKYNGPPPPPVVAVTPPPPGNITATVTAQGKERVTDTVVKAEIEDQRDALVRSAVGTAKSSLSMFFDAQRERIAERITTKGSNAHKASGAKADPGEWWDAEAEDEALQGTMKGIYVSIGRAGLQAVADNLRRMVGKYEIGHVIDDLLAYGGARIGGINEATQKAVQAVLAEGTRRGYSLNQLIDGVAAESYGGLKGAVLDNGTAAFDDYRAEMIARTETMLSFNRASVTGYGAFGVEQLQAYDGDQDPECADRLAGNPYTIDEALAQEDHPNGTLVWSPIVGDKAVHDDDRLLILATKAMDALSAQPVINVNNNVTPPDVHIEMAPTTIPVSVAAAEVNVPPTVVNVTVPEQAAPEVRFDPTFQIAAPEVTVEAAQITVEAPNVTIEAPPPAEVHVMPPIVNVPEQPPIVNVTLPDTEPPTIQVDVHVPEPRAIKRKVVRDKAGAITHIEES